MKAMAGAADPLLQVAVRSSGAAVLVWAYSRLWRRDRWVGADVTAAAVADSAGAGAAAPVREVAVLLTGAALNWCSTMNALTCGYTSSRQRLPLKMP